MGRRYRAYIRWYFIYTQVPNCSPALCLLRRLHVMALPPLGAQVLPGICAERIERAAHRLAARLEDVGVDHVVGLRILSGSSAFTIAGLSAHRTGGHKRGLQVLREGCKRLPRIGFALKGRITYLLQGLSFFVTLLAPLLIDGALGLRLAGCGVDQDPALLHATVEGRQLVIAIVLVEHCHGLWVGVGQDGLGVA